MAAKRDELMLYNDRAKLAQFMHEGITSPQELADLINSGRENHLHISRQTIINDIKWLKETWKESAVYDYEAYRQQILDELNHLKNTAWREFHKSKDREIIETIESNTPEADVDAVLAGDSFGNDLNVSKMYTRKRTREGNVAYLQLIEKIIERQCKISGIDAPNKLAITDTKGNDVANVKDSILNIMSDMGDELTRAPEKPKDEDEEDDRTE